MVTESQTTDFTLQVGNLKIELAKTLNHLRLLDLPEDQKEVYMASLAQFALGTLDELLDFVEEETG